MKARFVDFGEIEIVAVPTEEACGLISKDDGEKVWALLHVTC